MKEFERFVWAHFRDITYAEYDGVVVWQRPA